MSFNSLNEAQLYVALLESAGVRAMLQNDIATQVYPPIGMMLPVNILVAEEDQQRAREILGAKFDIDDFHRQADNSGLNPARREPKKDKKPRGKVAKKSGEKQTAATKTASAGKMGRPKKKVTVAD